MMFSHGRKHRHAFGLSLVGALILAGAGMGCSSESAAHAGSSDTALKQAFTQSATNPPPMPAKTRQAMENYLKQAGVRPGVPRNVTASQPH